MRQRRVTGIEERLAPYSYLILKPSTLAEEQSVAPHAGTPLRFDQAYSQDRDKHNFARLSSRLTLSCGSLPENKKLASFRQIYLRRQTSVNIRVSAEARCIVRSCSPQKYHLRWYQRASELYGIPKGFDRIYAEFGCGRGRFINTLAENDPDGLYIGIEGCKTIVLRAIQKTHTAGLKNLFYIDSFINDAATAFEENTLAGLFLNFSDPWPKERHAERRLTAPAKAASYKRVLKPGGFVVLKTDSEAFFSYSLKAFKEAGFQTNVITTHEPVIANHESVITNSKPAIANHESVITNSKPVIANHESVITNSEPVIANYESVITNSKPVIASEGAPSGAVEAKQSSTLPDVAAFALATNTEYEERFRAEGQPIYCFQAIR